MPSAGIAFIGHQGLVPKATAIGTLKVERNGVTTVTPVAGAQAHGATAA
jgi:hypothetical protein